MKIPQNTPDWSELAAQILSDDSERLLSLMQGSAVDSKGRYLHWDEMRHRTPPDGLTLNEWWVATAANRFSKSRKLPFDGSDRKPFWFVNLDQIQEKLHRIDQQASGQIQTDEIISAGSSNRYLVSSLVEEAITSSLLEGAATTRQAAKELILTARKPRHRSEQMIVNNYQAMLLVEELSKSTDSLTPDVVLEIHRVVTENTLEEESEAGRLQQPGERRVAVTWSDAILHVPPAADELPKRLEQLCAFANGETETGFLHPVIRAVLVHFWLAYDHPFVDGNGRTARALFYWVMLRAGYWLAQYISISSVLCKAPAKYARSFLHSETDFNDATYFVIHQLDVLLRAIDDLREYLSRKMKEISEVEALVVGVLGLNHRQLAIVGDALRNPDQRFTIASQQRAHRVTYQTARTDLLGLCDLGLLTKVNLGRKFEFAPVSQLPTQLRSL